MCAMPSDAGVAIYFSDFFGIDPDQLSDYGAFDVSLVSDLPLFVDPFLLFNSKKDEYQLLHGELIRYLQFLLDKSSQGTISNDEIAAWFKFPEVKETWLGFSESGNSGSGLGSAFGRDLYQNLTDVFRDFGKEKVTQGTHVEKLCLVAPGVGRDKISDLTVCLVKKFLLEFTQAFATEYLPEEHLWKGSVERTRFDYETESWVAMPFMLPKLGNSYVILTPKDLLKRDETWINKRDFLTNFEQLAASLPDNALRGQLNNYLRSRLVFPQRSTAEERRKIRNEAIISTIRKYPEIIEYYIRGREDEGDLATSISEEEVADVFSKFVEHIGQVVADCLGSSGFYHLPYDSYEETMTRLLYLKDAIENQDVYRLFYRDDVPIQREKDLQLTFKLTWFGSAFDMNAEVNNGRGPVDFKVSKGGRDKTLVEFKLAANSQLKRAMQNQLAIYEKANNTRNSIWAICYFSENELSRVEKILIELELQGSPNIVLIDCRKKPSASVA